MALEYSLIHGSIYFLLGKFSIFILHIPCSSTIFTPVFYLHWDFYYSYYTVFPK